VRASSVRAEDGSSWVMPPAPSPAEFGWIVPVPSPPAVGSMNRDAAQCLFELGLRQHSTARMIWLGDWVTIAAGLLILGAIALDLRRGRRKRAWVTATIVGAAIVVGFLRPATMSARRSSEVDSVRTLESGRFGIYDVAVIEADAPGPLVAWLNERDLDFDDHDLSAFRAHIERGGCFVVARVAPDADVDLARESYLDPLALMFESDEIVYPYALTATVDHPVTVVLYVVAPHRVGCEGLETRVAMRTENLDFDVRLLDEPDAGRRFGVQLGAAITWELGTDAEIASRTFENGDWMTILTATVPPGSLSGDIVLGNERDVAYRWTVMRW
ncbi:MAG: DUF2330 domain-containing protein, partial [Planctomycetes bacterium]|nr:DUF2330 domain-containing protein [Planctomycetota bacterium]